MIDIKHVEFTPDKALYPFESRWFDSSVGPVHYIDEGEGRPLVLMHGNPDWSFLYRKMIPRLSPHFRCIAMDYPGFGLSVHPDGYSYLPSAHARVVTELIEHLDLQDAILMGQDWGGPIGLDVASRSHERFTGLVIGNTFGWPAHDRRQRVFSKISGTRFMQRLYRQRNLFVKRVMPTFLQVKLSDAEFAHYTETAPSPEFRAGHAVFPAAIVGESSWLAEMNQRVRTHLSDRPVLFVMGMKDKVLTSKSFFDRWSELFPNATWVELPEAGHFFQEDAPEDTAAAIIDKFAGTAAS
ncbi:MAG: alpha/beta fold hydrolase [Actinomycetia bacterium]|nr:alpha/beta fold hydrolase [Actinomycetes bacterium]